jgi:hypothetical protein
MKTNTALLKGKWVISYNPSEYKYTEILDTVADIRVTTPYNVVDFNNNRGDSRWTRRVRFRFRIH